VWFSVQFRGFSVKMFLLITELRRTIRGTTQNFAMKIALVHDFLMQDGGAERVLSVLAEIWPDAPIFTVVADKRWQKEFGSHKINTSFLEKLPFGRRFYQAYLPFIPLAVKKFNLADFDVILSSSSAFAKGIKTPKNSLHICYCHTPTRYLWNDTCSYLEELPYSEFVKKMILEIFPLLRKWDIRAANSPQFLIANSKTVERRIGRYYGRTSDIIYPPVETGKFHTAEKIGNYFLIGGRLVSYKRFDLAIEAFNRLGMPLKIFGAGREYKKLKSIAKKNIEFLGAVSENEKAKLLGEALAFIYPQEEDFGLTAVEAMASGRPVIAYAKGGALETVIPGLTGELFSDQTWEALAFTIFKFKPENYNPEAIRNFALQFDKEVFKERISQYVNNKLKERCDCDANIRMHTNDANKLV
jgi:glycosyltransferase involved in cell wall biosynthesis